MAIMPKGRPSLVSETIAAVKNSPREIFNPYIFFCTFTWSFSGVAKGFDEGTVFSILLDPLSL